ncbi:GTPase [Lonepinella sp. BR2357]|uniref:GTPase n=1 Tax=Lonepinella sp. BR2357 TaxID=3434549 RepID=UPI003F6DCB6E
MSTDTQYLDNSFNSQTGELELNKVREKLNSERPNVNIILFGQSGVGKSALINAVFGSNVVRTGKGEPITQHLEKIVLKEKGISLWDTKGIEAEDYEGTINQLKNDLEKEFNKQNTNEMPHVAWLCIKESSDRIEAREKNLLKIAKELGIPTVVVFTNKQWEKGDEFVEIAKTILEETSPNFIKNRYIRVNSVEESFCGIILPKEGLKELLSVTETCLQEGLANAGEKGKKYIQQFRKAQIADRQKRLEAMIEGAKNKIHIASVSAGVAGASPIPCSDAPIIAGIQSTMIYAINSEFELEMGTSTATSLIAGVLGTTALAQLGKSAVSNILKFIPVVGTAVGATISAATAVAITEAVGFAYISVLEHYYNLETGNVELPAGTADILNLFKSYFDYKK